MAGSAGHTHGSSGDIYHHTRVQMESLVEKLCHRFNHLYIDPMAVKEAESRARLDEDDDSAQAHAPLALIEMPSSAEILASVDDKEGTEAGAAEGAEGAEGTEEGAATKEDADDEAVADVGAALSALSVSTASAPANQATTEQQMMLKQCRDIAYCLSQLSYSAPGPIKKFMGCFR